MKKQYFPCFYMDIIKLSSISQILGRMQCHGAKPLCYVWKWEWCYIVQTELLRERSESVKNSCCGTKNKGCEPLNRGLRLRFGFRTVILIKLWLPIKSEHNHKLFLHNFLHIITNFCYLRVTCTFICNIFCLYYILHF